MGRDYLSTVATVKTKHEAGCVLPPEGNEHMCRSCWTGYGRPSIRTPETERVATLIRALYDMGACDGGNLHIVTDDWNLEDHDLASCRESVRNIQAGRPGPYDDTHPLQIALEAEILDHMEPMTEDERASALAIWEGWAVPPGGG